MRQIMVPVVALGDEQHPQDQMSKTAVQGACE